MQCDCEMENCKSAKTHKVGACRETPAVKITIFGLKENLCERCFYQVNPEVVEHTEHLVKID